MEPTTWIAIASTATAFAGLCSALAAFGSWRVATVVRREQRLRESKAEVHIESGLATDDSHSALYVWNGGPATAFDVRASALMITGSGEFLPSKQLDLGPEAASLTPGSCIQAHLHYPEGAAGRLLIDLRWEEELPVFGVVSWWRRLRGAYGSERRPQRRVQTPGAKPR